MIFGVNLLYFMFFIVIVMLFVFMFLVVILFNVVVFLYGYVKVVDMVFYDLFFV